MKVLFFIHTYNEKNGIAIHVKNIVERLNTKGISTQVIYGKYFSLPFFSSLRIPFFEFFDALKSDFDIIHIHGYGNFFSFFGALISLIKRKPLIWTIHGYPNVRGIKYIFYLFYRYILAPIIFYRVDKIISVSYSAVQILKQETTKEITVIPNGVDTNHFLPCNYLKNKYVCYIGRLDKDKNVELLSSLNRNLLIVGPNEDNYKSYLESHLMCAEFLEVNYTDMPRIYCKCKYVILPSKYEGFPLVMLESLSSMIPFISTPVGDVPRILKDLFGKDYQLFLIKSNINKVLQHLDSKNLKSILIKARKKIEKKYSWDYVIEKLINIYSNLIVQ